MWWVQPNCRGLGWGATRESLRNGETKARWPLGNSALRQCDSCRVHPVCHAQMAAAPPWRAEGRCQGRRSREGRDLGGLTEPWEQWFNSSL